MLDYVLESSRASRMDLDALHVALCMGLQEVARSSHGRETTSQQVGQEAVLTPYPSYLS